MSDPIQGTVVPPVIMRTHYTAFVRSRSALGAGTWMNIGVNGDASDPVSATNQTRQYWPEEQYEMKLVAVELPVVEEKQS